MFVALTVVIFLNPWTFRIMQHNLLIVFLIFMMSALLYKAMSGTITKKITVFCVMLLIPIMVFQWKTTTPQSLTLLENDEQRVRETRLTFYNPSSHYVRLLFYKLNLKNFLEGELHTASFRIQRNFFESIDPNIYFFGGHPRARVWANDFEKFPFILIFPFLIGMYLVVRRKLFLIWGYFLISFALLSFVGHKNSLGPFILFPPLVVVILTGIEEIKVGFGNLPKKYSNVILVSTILIFLLSVIQVFTYA